MIDAVLLNDTRNDMHWGCYTAVESIYALAGQAGINIIASAPAHQDWKNNRDFMLAMEQVPLIIVNGEGTIHHNRPAAKYLLAAGRFARRNNKKAVLINATWQDNSQEYIDMVREFDIVSVRESGSATELRGHSVNCRIVPDMALLHQPAQTSRDGVAYTDCVIGPKALQIYRHMWRHGAHPISMFYQHKNWRNIVVSLRRFLPKFSFLNPVLAVRAIRGAVIDYSSQHNTRDNFTKALGSKNLVVTGRFHMLIFALSTQTPFLVIDSNTHKNQATLNDSGLGSWRLVSVDKLNTNLIARAQNWEVGEIEALNGFTKNSRNNMRKLFADIRELVA